MSHFACGVLVPKKHVGEEKSVCDEKGMISGEMHSYVECQLEPYSEDRECGVVDMGVVSRDEMKRFREYYATKDVKNKMLSFKKLYEKYGNDWNGGMWKYDEEGDAMWHEYSSKNPDARWDWYEIGGRWGNLFNISLQNGKTVRRSAIKVSEYKLRLMEDVEQYILFAYLAEDVGWCEQGTMLMFGAAKDEKEQSVWKDEVMSLLDGRDDDWIVVVDCHT